MKHVKAIGKIENFKYAHLILNAVFVLVFMTLAMLCNMQEY